LQQSVMVPMHKLRQNVDVLLCLLKGLTYNIINIILGKKIIIIEN
jgi:hypothetical protein